MTIKPEKFVTAVKRGNRRYSIKSKIHIAISLFYSKLPITIFLTEMKGIFMSVK